VSVSIEDAQPLLSIVTVVRNDLAGLTATLDSTSTLDRHSVERIVIDGSDRPEIASLLRSAAFALPTRWISEPDSGIYDAMNKGMTLSRGRFVLFLNAGDLLRSEFIEQWQSLKDTFARESCVLVGHAIEIFGRHQWLHPGIGRESTVFAAPQHQATFYPRAFFGTNQYRTDRPISADGEYTQLGFRTVGGAYLPAVVSQFSLGGLSSNYRSFARLRRRVAEHRHDWRMKLKLRLKFVMWWTLPRVWFYSVLAIAAKYTKVPIGHRVALAKLEIRRAAESFT
jgi:putative colanic acid biosynthesis glycosyltransferase